MADPTKFALKASLDVMSSTVTDALQSIATAIDISGTTVAEVRSGYEALQTSIQTTKTGADAATTQDLTAQITALNGTLSGLNKRKDTLLAGQPPKPFFDQLLSDMATFSFQISVVTASILGGIVASHAFIAKPAIYRFYYFVFGAIFFPLSLIYGMLKPPVYRALLIPLVMKGLNEPAWSNFILFKPFGLLFKYDPPNGNDTAPLLAIFSGLALASILITGIIKGII